MLGLLGLIPIYLGIKVAIYDDCEGEKRAKKELDEKGLSKLVGIVALVTVASCGQYLKSQSKEQKAQYYLHHN